MKKILNSILILVICINLWVIFKYFHESYKNKHIVNDLKADIGFDAEKTQKTSSEINDFYENNKKINKDYIGWIEFPGAEIDFPVVQTTNNSDYLSLDFNRNKNRFGTIFIDYRNKVGSNGETTDNNIVFYGHNMRDESMFFGLEKLRSHEFFQKNKYIYFKTKNKINKYQIFSVYSDNKNDKYNRTSFENKDDYKDFLEKIKSKSFFKPNEDLILNEESKIITLSTCDYDEKNGRFVVHAVLQD